jgi:hypothetical protein
MSVRRARVSKVAAALTGSTPTLAHVLLDGEIQLAIRIVLLKSTNVCRVHARIIPLTVLMDLIRLLAPVIQIGQGQYVRSTSPTNAVQIRV